MDNRYLAPKTEEFKSLPGYPTKERMEKGMVAVIECEQEIPCNPCETSCPNNAITVGNPITNLPVFDGDACTGCGFCVARCPGQAVFMIDMTYTDSTALVGFPYEYVPVPSIGQEVDVVNRDGEVLGKGFIRKIQNAAALDKTNVVYVEVDKGIGEEVRSIAKL